MHLICRAKTPQKPERGPEYRALVVSRFRNTSASSASRRKRQYPAPMTASSVRRCRGLFALALCSSTLLFAGCDDGGSPSSPSGAAATITITANGVTPTEVRIAAGGRVQFVNSDSRPHAVSSDPLQVHTDCPAINDVGTLSPGQSRSTGVLSAVRTCGFHDHTNEFDDRWKGRIVVQ